MPTSLRLNRPPPSRSFANAVALGCPVLLLGVTVLQACAAGGADPALWESGGNPAPGAGGAGGATTTASASSTGSGPTATSSSAGTGSTSGASTSSSATSSASTSSGATSGSSATSSASTTSSSTSSSSGATTWTEIYDAIFGPSGTSTCTGGSCHTSERSGFACGTTADACCEGFIAAGYVTQGSGSTSSALTDPTQTCLCGTGLTGNMPKSHSCVTAAQIAEIKAWLATGAPCN